MAYAAFDLTGKVALITGGNSGIGLGMAPAIAQAGAAVCLWGANAEKNARAGAAPRDQGGRARSKSPSRAASERGLAAGRNTTRW